MVLMISVHKSCQPSVLRRNNRLKSLVSGSFCITLVALRTKFFSTNYRIFSEDLGSDGGSLESAFVLCYSQVNRVV